MIWSCGIVVRCPPLPFAGETTHIWHPDGIHAVESKHAGAADSSVFYIPAAPLTARNAEYLAIQRQTLMNGHPAPDFPGGAGEEQFVGAGRGRVVDVKGVFGKQAMGLEKVEEKEGMSAGERRVVKLANEALGF